jgi:predicted MFS family arabinose efflux permease
MDRRLLVLALGMFALGTDSFVVAGVLPEISRHFQISIGGVIGGLGDWRWAMVFVSVLAAASLVRVAFMLAQVPLPP